MIDVSAALRAGLLTPSLRAFLLAIEQDLKAAVELGAVMSLVAEEAVGPGLTPAEAGGLLRLAHLHEDHIGTVLRAWRDADELTQAWEATDG